MEEAQCQNQQHPKGNGHIGHIEDARLEEAQLQLKEIGHGTVQHTINEIAQAAPYHKGEGDSGPTVQMCLGHQPVEEHYEHQQRQALQEYYF